MKRRGHEAETLTAAPASISSKEAIDVPPATAACSGCWDALRETAFKIRVRRQQPFHGSVLAKKATRCRGVMRRRQRHSRADFETPTRARPSVERRRRESRGHADGDERVHHLAMAAIQRRHHRRFAGGCAGVRGERVPQARSAVAGVAPICGVIRSFMGWSGICFGLQAATFRLRTR